MLRVAQIGNKKVANSLVAAGTAAVLAVYAAGYARTRSAADQFEAQSEERRPAAPGGRGTASPNAGFQATTPNAGRGEPSTAASAPSNPARGVDDKLGLGKSSLIASAEPAPTMAYVPGGTAGSSPAPATSAPSASAVPVANPAAEQRTEVAAVAPVAALPAAPAASAPALAASAPAPSAPAAPAPAPAAPVWKDGTYTGWGTSRHGDIQSQVVIEGGRIASATIAQCLTRYSCSVISRLPPQVAQRQSPEVDYVSGATQSANAFYYGVVEALKQAK